MSTNTDVVNHLNGRVPHGTPAPGDLLPNGATVIQAWPDYSQEQFGDYRPQGIVLALAPFSPEPYATWTYCLGDYGVGTFNGHYFGHIFNAAKDFSRRIGNRTEEN